MPPRPPQTGPAPDRRLPLAAIAAVTAFAGITFLLCHGLWPADLMAVYLAAQFYAQGALDQVYAAPSHFFGSDIPRAWLDAVAGFGLGERSALPYVYPPLWAALLAPVTGWLAPMQFAAVVLALHLGLLSLALLVLVPRLTGAPLGPTWGALWGIAVLTVSLPGMLALVNDQPQYTVLCLTLAAMTLYGAGWRASGGALLGLAAAMKLSPALFALIFLADRDLRAFAGFAVTGALLAAASVALAGADLHWAFLARLRSIDELLVFTRLNYSPATLLGLAAPSVALPVDPDPIVVTTAPEPAWIALTTRLAALAGALAILWRTWGLEPRARLCTRLCLLAALVALTGPLSWAHYLILPLLLLPGALARLGRGEALAWLAAGLALQSVPSHLLLIHAPWATALPVGFWLLLMLRLTLDTGALPAAHRAARA